jgi:hypothetical protein
MAGLIMLREAFGAEVSGNREEATLNVAQENLQMFANVGGGDLCGLMIIGDEPLGVTIA